MGARLVALDVTNDDSVAAASQLVQERGGLEVLVNNVGVEGGGPNNSIVGADAVTARDMREAFDTNVFGVVRVTHAFLPLLEKSAAPVIVNVTSSLGSLQRAQSPRQWTVVRQVAPGRSAGGDLRHRHDDARALCDGLGSGATVKIGVGVESEFAQPLAGRSRGRSYPKRRQPNSMPRRLLREETPSLVKM